MTPMLQTNDRPTKLARALQELGRLVKSLCLLRYIDDESCRRRILIQLNRGGGRHQFARIIFHGKRGEPRQRYREGHENQLGALDHLRADGHDVRPDDVARLSPLGFKPLNMLGRDAFTIPEIVARGELRPLRDPRAVGIDDV